VTIVQAETSTENVAQRLTATARIMPDALGVVVARHGRRRQPQYSRWTFRELDDDSDCIARGLVALGVQPGCRLALLVPPGYEFIALVFALFKSGAVPILIDPGMGRGNMLRCLSDARPEGFVAIPPAQAVRALLRRRFADAQLNVTVGRRWFWRGPTLDELRRSGDRPLPLPAVRADDPAAIIFTTGSTGPPKGALYRHGNFDAQVDEIRDCYGIQQGEVDLACFPLFGLFNCAMGVTTVIPDLDAARPASVDPATLIRTIEDLGVTQSFGSPAIWNRVGRYCRQRGVRMSSLRRVMSAGAPVSPEVLELTLNSIAEGGEVHTPYGATEALPVASISAREVLDETATQTRRGAGTCVGRRFPGIEWHVVRIVDGPIGSLADAEMLPTGEVGELIVSGPVVTREYINPPEANERGKIYERGTVWHRMGDIGYLDAEERFWYCGRLTHRVRTASSTLYTDPCEAIFNCHPEVFRSALVGVGKPGIQRPVIIVEPHAEHWPRRAADRERLVEELRVIAASQPMTAGIRDFLFHRSLPVDIRHNAKIFREQLVRWAAAGMGATDGTQLDATDARS
jgi:olefin beta-lactone synthetase